KDVKKITEFLKRNLYFNGEKATKFVKFIIAGSARRKKFPCRDIDYVLILKVNPQIFEISIQRKQYKIIWNGMRKVQLKLKYKEKYRKIDMFFVLPKEKPYAMLQYTGSKIYNIRLRAHAKAMNLKLNQYGLFKNGKRISLKTESDVQRYLG